MARPLLPALLAALLLAPAAGAQDMAPDAEPAYGVLRPTTEAAALDLVARRAAEVPDALRDEGCAGFLDRSAPDAVVDWGGGDLRIWAVAEFDPTLVVHGPDGTWSCDDDGGDGYLPAVDLAGAAAGRYAVWLGTFSLEPLTDAATLYAGPPPPPTVLDAAGPPQSGRVAAAGGFEAAQGAVELAVQAGGPDAAESLALPDPFLFCNGYIDADAPTAVVDYTAEGGTGALAIGATAVADDLVLVVEGPDGAVLCNDDFNGTDPAVSFDAPASGAYAVWVGTFQFTGAVPATLTVSETAPENEYFDYDHYGGPYSEGSYTPLDLDAVPGPRAAATDGGGGTVEVSVVPASLNPVQGMACGGFIEPAATAAVTLAGEGPFAVTATGEADLTLTLRTPSGGWFCSDDAAGLDPGIQIDDAEDGLYLVWVGAFSDDGTAVEATLSAAPGTVEYEEIEYDDGFDRTTQSDGTYDGGELSTGPATHTADLEGATAYTQAVTAGGPVLNPVAGEVCGGFLPAAPTAALEVAEAGPLVVAATSETDLTLVVRAGGAWTCSDDADGSDPAIELDVAPGTVEVWVGTFSRRDEPVPATLRVGR